MPRVQRLKTTTLHLPNANSSSARADAPTLEVLMMAQKIAKERGQVFDIEAFLTPAMREQWTTISSGQPWPVPTHEGEGEAGPSTSATVPSPGRAAVDVKPEDVDEGTAPHSVPEANGAADTATTTATATESAPTSVAIDPAPNPVLPTDATPLPSLATPQKQPFKLHANSPALLNLHWKQRQKRLQQLAIREAAIERGEEPEYFPELEALIRGEEEREKEKEREEEVGQKRKRGLTEGDVEGIRASASHWNHLLIEARRLRGPQWDYNTQLFLVDKSSPHYYTHGKPPPEDEEERVQPQKAGSNGVEAHAVDHSSASSSSRPLPPHRQSSSPAKPTPVPERRPSATPSTYSMPLPPQTTTPHAQNAPTPTPHMGNGMNGASPSPHAMASGHLPPHLQHPGYAGSPSQPQHQQPPPQFNQAQWLALQAQHQHQQQQGGAGPGGMNTALLMQAQQRLQQQQQQQRQASGGAGAGGGGGGGFNMAALMGQGQGQGQGGQPWNPAMGMSPAMLQGMAGQSGQGGPMLSGGGWNGGQ